MPDNLIIVTVLLLNLINYVFGQGAIGNQDTCLDEQSVPDNLSCPRIDGVLQCIPRSILCDNTEQCPSGADEGDLDVLGTLVCECRIYSETSLNDHP